MNFRFGIFWLFVLTTIFSLATAFYCRLPRTLECFLPPSTLSHRPLEFQWDPYSEVIVFSADEAFADVDQWYTDNFKILTCDRSDHDPGQLTNYFDTDADGRSISVCLADTSVQRAVDNLTSYVGSDRLKKLVDSKPSIVGVLFLEE